MKFRLIISQLLTVAACIALVVEAGEFLLVTYVWAFASRQNVAPAPESAVILGTSLLVGLTLIFFLASQTGMALGKAWISTSAFVRAGLLVVTIQGVLFGLGYVRFDGEWLMDFFNSKNASFAVGAIAALVLVGLAIFNQQQKGALSRKS